MLASLLCIAAPASAFTEQRTVQRKSAKKPPAEQQEVPPARPTPPPTLQQQPAVPPQVTLNQGQMTIVAQNSTLGDILRAVRTQTGAAMDIPSSATERVVVNLGPGTPSDVLASLLKGSHFNYVILSSPTEANKLQRVVLTSKSGGADAGPANQQSPEPASASAPQPQPMNQGQPDENNNGTDDGQPNDDDNATPDANQNPDQPAPAPIKSPEQLLQELQRQQQMPQGPPGQQEQPPATPPQQ